MLIITLKNLQKKIAINNRQIRRVVLKTLACKRKINNANIGICFCGDKLIRKINLKYLQTDSATDVISFDLTETPKNFNLVAEIIISTETAKRNSAKFGTSLKFETYLYLVHGLLHALGYRDRTKKESLLMQTKAEKILKSLKVKLNVH